MPVLSLVMPFKGQGDIDFALSLATMIAERELKANPSIPLLAKSGVRWKRDPTCKTPQVEGSCERFLSPLQVLAEGEVGDCDDIGPWYAAELRLGRGVKQDKNAQAKSRPSDIGYHVIVERSNGKIDDPSRQLGMGKRRKPRPPPGRRGKKLQPPPGRRGNKLRRPPGRARRAA